MNKNGFLRFVTDWYIPRYVFCFLCVMTCCLDNKALTQSATASHTCIYGFLRFSYRTLVMATKVVVTLLLETMLSISWPQYIFALVWPSRLTGHQKTEVPSLPECELFIGEVDRWLFLMTTCVFVYCPEGIFFAGKFRPLSVRNGSCNSLHCAA